MGRLDMAQNAVEKTLEAARDIVAGLLHDVGGIEPGSLVRTEAAVVGDGDS